jgi:CheY-like chemotaxis protein
MTNLLTSTFTPVNFLVVDDDDVSILSFQRAMKKNGLANPTYIARDGIDALGFLDKITAEANGLPPIIVTLDLNMPRMNGIEFLDHIREHPIYSKLVVFVLTTSDSPDDIDAAYEKNIAGYIVKSLEMLTHYSNLIVLPEISAS